MDIEPHAGLVRIGDRELDRARGILNGPTGIIPVRAKTYTLLQHLVDNRGRVVSKDELLATVWPNVVVSEDSLTQCVRDLRKALGDGDQTLVKTVSRRGYLLTNCEFQTRPQSAPRGPSVAVLRFAAVGEADTVLVDGLVEEITNAIARFHTVAVIGRASSFSYSVDGRPSPREIGEQLGADYIVDGTFRKTALGNRISVTLTHAESGRQLWGERFQCADAQLLDLETVVTPRIVGRLVANIEESPLHRGVGTSSLAAFEFLARGRVLLRGYGAQNNLNARDSFLRAIETDSSFGLAYAYLALAEIIIGNYAAAPVAVLEKARDLVAKGIELSPGEPRCHRIMGLVRLYLREHDAADANMRRALALNPYDADAVAEFGFVLCMRSRAEEALSWVERAIELNPFHPPWYESDISFVYYSLGEYAKAASALMRVPEVSIFHSVRLAACYAMAGNLEKSAKLMSVVRRQEPAFDVAGYLRANCEFEHESELQHLIDGALRASSALSRVR